MKLIDANVMLRYLIGDGGELAYRARDLIESGEAYTYPEVLAEVVYVLSGVYGLDRGQIANAFRVLAQWMCFYDFEMLLCAFNLFEVTNMDFVDCLLVGRRLSLHEPVVSFDAQVNKFLGSAVQAEGGTRR